MFVIGLPRVPRHEPGRAMTYNAYYAEITAMAVFIVMGIRLRGVYAKTHGLPERCLSAAFLLWALGYVLWDVPALLTQDAWLLARCAFGGRVAIHLGTIALALFIRAVFRPDSRWAFWFVIAIAVSLLGGAAESARIGDWMGERPFAYASYWVELVAEVAPSAWMAVEGMIAYQRAAKRRRLGLCDALSCNRFLLWGLAGAGWAALEIVTFAQEFEIAVSGSQSFLFDLLMGACEFVPALLVWLAFFPPAAYRNWIGAARRPS
jgi:hypothetical protein